MLYNRFIQTKSSINLWEEIMESKDEIKGEIRQEYHFEKLSKFKENNPQCILEYDENEKKIIIEKPWNSDDIKLIFSDDEKQLNELNNIAIFPNFDAIIHIDKNEVEFIYGFLDTKNDSYHEIDRNFELFCGREKLICSFREPSKSLLFIAKNYYRDPTSIDQIASQITPFRDFQRLDKLPERVKKFFENRIPRNFFINTEGPISEHELKKYARMINFYMKYYDRLSPYIIIRNSEDNKNDQKFKINRYIENIFPQKISTKEIDEYLLQLIEVARETTPRFAYLYYYQVFEYAAFSYLDNKAKKELRKILGNPTIIECNDEDISRIFTFMCEKMESDDVKIQKVIQDYCNPSTIWKEIEIDKEFFCNPIIFDGDVVILPLIAHDTTEETWKTMWMPNLYKYFTTIRNSIAHSREKRQGTGITPSTKNSRLIKRILPLIRRTAEMIVIYKE
jgi:hypothetical protein